MISVVAGDRYPGLRELHKGRIQHHPLINAILSGIQTGRVYADPTDTILFACSRAGFCLLSALEPASSSFAREFWQFLHEDGELPAYIHIYDPPDSVESHITAACQQHKVRRRVQFHCHRSVPTYDYETLMPEGHRIETIQAVGIDRLEMTFQRPFAQHYWDSEHDLMANAIGVCLVDDGGEPRAVSYSAAVVDGMAEMDTFVAPECRGRRYMRIVSEPFFNLAMTRGLVPQWDTFVENAPSYLLAQRFHLSRVREYDLLSVVRR